VVEVDALEAAAGRARAVGATVQTDVPTTQRDHDELWLRDPDGYLVVLAG